MDFQKKFRSKRTRSDAFCGSPDGVSDGEGEDESQTSRSPERVETRRPVKKLRSVSPDIDVNVDDDGVEKGETELKEMKEKIEKLEVEKAELQKKIEVIAQHVQCGVCLEVLRRPFSIVPCGHTFCYDCLVKSFCPLGLEQAEEVISNADNADVVINQILSSPDALSGKYIEQKKLCPTCRCVVMQRPLEIFLIKDVVTEVQLQVASDKAQTRFNGNGIQTGQDPWRNLFKAQLQAPDRHDEPDSVTRDVDDAPLTGLSPDIHRIQSPADPRLTPDEEDIDGSGDERQHVQVHEEAEVESSEHMRHGYELELPMRFWFPGR